MSTPNRFIIFMAILIGCIGSLYFFSLLFFIPLYVTTALIVVAAALLFMWIIPSGATPDNNLPAYSNRKEWVGIVILAYGIIWMAIVAPEKANKYGEWDAYTIWNLHARQLADPQHWKTIFRYTDVHADYPLCLPATLAYFMRLFSSPDSLILPFVFHMLVTISLPALIYGELWRKNAVVAAIVLAMFPIQVFYIFQGTSQYADVLLSFFFLCAIICMNYSRQNRKYLMLSVLFLGCCAWTKNEGLLLATVMLVVYSRRYFAKDNIKYTLLTLLAPIAVIGTFKIICPVSNDLVSESGTTTWGYLLDSDRYIMVFNYFILTAGKKFVYIGLLFGIYLTICLVRKKRPGLEFLLFASCLFAYFMVYVLTPKDLKWHLYTSCERLFVQLYPLMLYAIGMDIARMKWSISEIVQQKNSLQQPITAGTKQKIKAAAPSNKHNRGKKEKKR